MMKYFCIVCNKVHDSNELKKDTTIFSSGFHFIDDVRYNAGSCITIIQTVPIKDQSATA